MTNASIVKSDKMNAEDILSINDHHNFNYCNEKDKKSNNDIKDLVGTDLGWQNPGPCSPYITYNGIKIKI
jgi:hypothetical protein